MKSTFDIVIAGAGPAGLLLASQLQRESSFKVTIVDAGERPAVDVDGEIGLRVSAIALGSVERLERVGAWSHIEATRVAAFERMRVWDASSSADADDGLLFDAAEFAAPALGYIVENERVRHAVLNTLNGEQDIIFDTPIVAIDESADGYAVELDNGRRLQADLLIGADGPRSFVRQQVGIETNDWPYGQMAFVTHLQPSEPHAATAWQRFLKEGPLGILPLADGRVSIVWSTTSDIAEVALNASDEELARQVTIASDYALGELQPAGPRGAFPLTARHAKAYVKPRVALVGDAAHAVHPLAGQGANLGLADADCLARILRDAVAAGEHPGDRPVLRRYERARKGENATMLHFMTGLNRLFTTDSSVVQELRSTGMRLFNASGPLREHVVGVALGTGR
ncbi:MAG: UbiH/UbiF/VisC/COQ6 family ubiquinone biosynthesis hydroxylase [Pseudomonadota bacterium]